MFDKHVCNVLNVTATFGCSDAVAEGYLLKSIFGRTNSNFPSVTALLVEEFDWISRIILSFFQEEVDVIFEVFDLKNSNK